MTVLPTGTVTFLFTDIEGSTRLVQVLRDDYSALLDRHARIVRDAIGAGDGVEVKTEGDSFFAVFMTPGQALRAAVAAQRSLASERWPRERQVRVRMGLHTGEGRLGAVDYVGLDVHRAARIAAAGHGGQVLLSDTTRALVEQSLPVGVTLRDLGRHRLKDIEIPEHLHQVVIEGLPADFGPLRTSDAAQTNLPLQRTSFIGRDREIEEVARSLVENRLVTLTGPGGSGKTRLAIAVASRFLGRFVDGVYFVDLGVVTDPASVAAAIAAALSVPEESGRDSVDSLSGYLREREMLVVLDNFEQIVDAAVVVGQLLDAAPGLKLLVTSRAVLHLSSEHEYSLAPMTLPTRDGPPNLTALASNEAVALFVARAQAVQPGFALTAENAPAVAELTVRLDGLPLAIELAASRVRLLPPAVLVERLEERLPLLTGGARDVPERQRTLRAAIDWSCDLLEAEERRLFARLAVFAGGWALESAEAVCSAGLELPVIDVLGALIDKSLVQEEAGLEPRFRMLETIREYAHGLLVRSGEEENLRARHARHFMELAERAEEHFSAADQVPWLARFEQEADNVRVAFEWCATSGDGATGARLATALWRSWSYHGRLRDGRAWLERFLGTAPMAGHDLHRFRALTALGGIAFWQNDYPAMGRAYEEALAIARELGDPALVGRALHNTAFIAVVEQDDQRAARRNREALVEAERAGDRELLADIKTGLAFVEYFHGDPAAAIEDLSAAVAVYRELKDERKLADTLVGLGSVVRMTGDRAGARRHFLESLRLSREVGHRPMMAGALQALAMLAIDEHDADRAARLLGASAALRQGLEVRPPPEIISRMGDPEGAARRSLGERGFADARAEGYAMTMDDAIAFALAEGAPAADARDGSRSA